MAVFPTLNFISSLSNYHHSSSFLRPIVLFVPLSVIRSIHLQSLSKFIFEMFLASLLLASTTFRGVFAAPALASGDTLSKRCVNSATDRSCWGDYDISTNYYDTVPDTGVVREYWFNIENSTAAPDGIERIVLTVNGLQPCFSFSYVFAKLCCRYCARTHYHCRLG
jgi:hypothetical protein